MPPKTLQKCIKKCTRNFIDFLIDFGRHLVSLGLPFGSQNRFQNRSRPPLEHREPFGACSGASGPSKVTKNGARSEPKTLKIDPLDVSRLPKRSPRAPNMESQKHQISKNGLRPREPKLVLKQIKHQPKHTQNSNPN